MSLERALGITLLGTAGTMGLMLRGWGNLLFFSQDTAESLGFLSRYPDEFREPLVLPQGSQVSIRVMRECTGLLWILGRGIRPQFPWKARSQGVSQGWQDVWVPSRCDGDLREPLILSLATEVSFRVVRGLSGFLLSWFRELGPYLQLKWEIQGSSLVLTWISGFLWRFSCRVNRRLRLWHVTLLPSRGVKEVSCLLLC